MRAVVFANGERPSAAVVADVVHGASLVVAADGGAAAALAAGVTPDVVIGDLDSVGSARDGLPRGAVIRDADPDRTDLQKALDLCLARGVREAVVVGAGGGRADHALANLSLLFMYRGRLAVSFVDEQFVVSAVDRASTCAGPPGTVVSLVAIGECRGVTTNGLRWDLREATLRFSPLGVHNEIARSPAEVSVRSGDLLLFSGRWVEKHG